MHESLPATDKGNSAPARRRFTWISLALFVALALLHTWPLILAPSTFSRNDNADTVLHQWILAWLAHQVVQDPLSLFDANIFYPDRLTLAYSDHLFIPGIFVAPLLWAGASPVLAYNLLLIAGFALTGWTMCSVIYRWTGSQLAGVISGSLAAFNAFTLTRFPQIQDQHLEFLPLALWGLDRLLQRPSLRRALSLSGWFVLQSLTTVYWLLFTTVAMVVATAVRPRDWLIPGRRTLVIYAVLAGLVAGGLLFPFLLPYWIVSREQGLVRTLEEIAFHSATMHNYLATGSRLHFSTWSEPFYTVVGDPLFPGGIALLLVATAVGSGVALRDPRARMALGFGIVAFALSFGPKLPGYALLYEVFPLMAGVRGVGRFGQLCLIAVAMLAGFGWSRISQAIARLPQRAFRHSVLPLGVVVVLGIHAEAVRAPMAYTPAPVVPEIWNRLPKIVGNDVVLAFFPFYSGIDTNQNSRYMSYTSRAFQPMLNGYSGFYPPSFHRHTSGLRPFPDEQSLDYLRQVGVTHVIAVAHLMRPSVVAKLDTLTGLQLLYTDGNVPILRLQTGRLQAPAAGP